VGRLDYLLFPEGGRIETAVEEGDAISPFYDPMIAKLVVHAEDRKQAIARLAELASGCEIWPVRTNAGFIERAMRDLDFISGQIDTGFISKRGDSLIPSDVPDDLEWGTAAAFALSGAREDDEELAGFRLNAPHRISVTLTNGGETRTVTDDLIAADATGFTDDERVLVFNRGTAFEFTKSSRNSGHHSAHDGDILSPMPGKIIAVEVAAGDSVTKGQKLLTLEAMKMEHTLVAPFDGVVAELSAVAGAQVQVEALLARIEASE
jgi:3-methylcrotonyl-CoA carboxylase alpha subunit